MPGHTTPPNMSVDIADGQNTAVLIAYPTATTTDGAAPMPLSFASVSTNTAMPHAFVGQIRSRAGVGSGFVVRPLVVATAAHVVWDDVSESTAQEIEWLFQKHAGEHEPRPLIPRGHYLITGYAAQRHAENTPGTSTPASQTLDVATLYFNEKAGRDGYSGYLASDLPDNSTEYLLAIRDKTLIGYPFDGISPLLQGVMHATPAADIVFTHASARTYSTTDIHGVGGMSGGPLCVQHTNGNWYPAAIYLGGNAQTTVRVIDSQVIDLITAAVNSATTPNHTGGGVTHTSIASSAGTTVGALTVVIEPERARNAGAGWRLAPEASYRASGFTKSNLTPGTYILQFPTVNGFDVPSQQNVTIAAGTVSTLTFRYDSPQESWRRSFFGFPEDTGNAADNADPDGDGFTNAAEYAAGTNPTVPGDFFKVTETTRSGETFSLSTAGKAGRTYHLERSVNLNNWTTVTSNGPVTVEGPVTLTDPSSTGGAAFYRIRVTGP
ncbi:MAG: trypsin-like peptidase domain-containing protein [Verrucomicrobiaceae bacterium]|nr:trypsin-like peptidase domain-containing protein [Verrucomicrobiaceae bacterium]